MENKSTLAAWLSAVYANDKDLARTLCGGLSEFHRSTYARVSYLDLASGKEVFSEDPTGRKQRAIWGFRDADFGEVDPTHGKGF